MVRPVLLGLLLAWFIAPPVLSAGEAADAELKALTDRAAQPTKDIAALRSDLLRFGQRHPGTVQAVKAAGLLRDLPSPLDQLDVKNIPALEKFDWFPKGTIAVLGEHRGRQGGACTAVTYSKHGKWLASTSTNGLVRIWDPTNMRLLHTLGHGAGAYSVTFSKDNTLLAHGGGDGQVIIQDMAVEPPKTIETCKVASTPLMGLVLAPNAKWFVTGGSDSRLYLWDLSEKPAKELTGASGHQGAIYAVAMSPDAKTIASGGADKYIRLWTIVKNRLTEKSSAEAHAGIVHCLAFHPTEDKTLVSGGADGVIRIWNQTAGKLTPRFSLKAKGGVVNALTFSKTGNTLAAAFSDGNVRTYTMTAGGLVEKSVLEGHQREATGVAYSPDNNTLVSCGTDWTVRQWPAVAGPRPKDKTIKSGHWSHVYALAFSPDEKGLATCGYDHTARYWDLPAADIKERTPVMKAEGDAYTLAFAPEGKLLAVGGIAAKFRTFDVATGRAEYIFEGHTSQLTRLAFSPDGKNIASSGLDKTIRLWDPRSGKAGGSISTFETYVNAVAYSPDGKYLVCCSGYYLYDKAGRIVVKNGKTQYLDSTVRLYDATSLKELYRWKTETLLPSCVAFSADSKQFFAGVNDGIIRRWDAAAPAKEPDVFFKSSETGVSLMTCSPDGRWLASFGPDYRINIFDMSTGKVARFLSTGEQFGSLAWAPDSRHLGISVGTGVTLVVRLEDAKK